MLSSCIELTTNLKTFKRKRDMSLFFASAPLLILGGIFVLLVYVFNVSLDLLLGIYTPLALVYIGFVFYIRLKINFYSMNYRYYHMIVNGSERIGISGRLLSPSWLSFLIQKGYAIRYNDDKHSLYYKIVKKVHNKSTGMTILVVNIAKTKEYDFYNPDVDREVESILATHPDNKHIRKVITLQFKAYESFEESKDEIDKIICFKMHDNYIINITVGYFESTSEIYFLHPKKVYPNAFYYIACQEIKDLCGIKED